MSRGCPTIIVTNPRGYGSFQVDMRLGGWSELRKIVDCTGCTVTEQRVGWFTKRFTVRGDQEALNDFTQCVWDNGILGQDFRNEIRKVIGHG